MSSPPSNGAIVGDHRLPLRGPDPGCSNSVINSLFSGNDHYSAAGTIYNYGQGDLSLINCTIDHNITGGGGSGVWCASGAVTMRNCIVWGNGTIANEASQLRATNGTFDIANCCVQGWTGNYGGEGNFGSDPLFTDPDGPDDAYGTLDDDPQLASNSPCIDAGDASALPNDEFDLDEDGDTAETIPVDLGFHDRVGGAAVDLGAFESE